MKALIIYDSQFGNTEQVARTIAKVFGSDGQLVKANQFEPDMLNGVDLLLIGSPIQAWQPTQSIKNLLAGLQAKDLSGLMAAAFDTGFASIFAGNAARRITRTLSKMGCTIIVPPERFIVVGTEGPLADNELDHAKRWAQKLINTVGQIRARRAA